MEKSEASILTALRYDSSWMSSFPRPKVAGSHAAVRRSKSSVVADAKSMNLRNRYHKWGLLRTTGIYTLRVLLAVVKIESFRGRLHDSAAEGRTIKGERISKGFQLGGGRHGARVIALWPLGRRDGLDL